ncbi:MAG: hypothetical protein QOE34_1001 [Verrucomicrobiota bacterium]|jgi:hypothetical protein
MTTNPTIIIIAVLGLGFSSGALAEHNQDDLKQRILAQAQSVSPDSCAFTRTVRSEQTSNGKTEKHVNVEKFDPTKPGQARWTLVSVDGAPPPPDVLSRFQKDAAKRRVPGYYRLARYFGTSATASTDSQGRTVFHFSTLPKDTAIVFDTDVSQNTAADVSVSEASGVPFAEHVHLTVGPMRIKLLMKPERYESTARYRLGPEGKPLLVEHTADMTGSGMGQEGRVHTVTTYSDYRVVGN